MLARRLVGEPHLVSFPRSLEEPNVHLQPRGIGRRRVRVAQLPAGLDVVDHDEACPIPPCSSGQRHGADRQLLEMPVGTEGARVPLIVGDRDGGVLLDDCEP